MPILSIQTIQSPGLVNVNPSVIYIETTDSYATVTTAGYLTAQKQLGFTFSNDQMALVKTSDQGVCWLRVVITYSGSSVLNIVVSLSQSLPLQTKGTWIPVDTSGASLTLSGISAAYTVIGNMVYAYARLIYPTTANTANNQIGGLPFTVPNFSYASQGILSYTQSPTAIRAVTAPNTTNFNFYTGSGDVVQNVGMSATTNYVLLIYPLS